MSKIVKTKAIPPEPMDKEHSNVPPIPSPVDAPPTDVPPVDEPVVEDVDVDVEPDMPMEDGNEGPAEKYGAQVLRRMHEIHTILMQEGDEMLGHLENEHVEALLQEVMKELENRLSGFEKMFKKLYKDLPELSNGMPVEDETEGDVPEEDNEMKEVEEVKDISEDDKPAVPDDSAKEPLPTPEEAIEGMKKTKALEDEEKDELKKEDKAIPAKFVKVKHVCAACKAKGKTECDCDEKALKTKELCTGDKCQKEMPMRSDPNGLDPKERNKVNEVVKYLKELSEPESYYDDEKRLNAYHYAKAMEDISGDDELESETKSVPGSPEWEKEERQEPEHKAYRKMCKDASCFLKALAYEKAFGEPHREGAKFWHRSLEPMAKEENDGKLEHEDKHEEEEYVGEMGEKHLEILSLKKQIERDNKEMEELSKKLASLAI